MLPQTRKEVFFDVMKLHGFDLLMLGGLLFIAFLPVLIITVVNDAYEMQRMAEVTKNSSPEALHEVYVAVASFRNSSAFINIPCYLIFAVAFAGMLRLIRQYATEEIVFFWQDFWKGIRQNGKQIMLLATVMGVCNAVGRYLISNGRFAQGGKTGLIGLIFCALTVFVFLPAWGYMTVLIAIYDNTFLQNMQLAFALYAKTLGKTLLVQVALGAVLLVSFLPNFVCHLLGRILGILLLPVSMLIWSLFVLEQLDRYINPLYFPELTGKGLYKPEEQSAEKPQNQKEGETMQ